MRAGEVAVADLGVGPFKTIASCRRLLSTQQYRAQVVSVLLSAVLLVFAYDTYLMFVAATAP